MKRSSALIWLALATLATIGLSPAQALGPWPGQVTVWPLLSLSDKGEPIGENPVYDLSFTEASANWSVERADAPALVESMSDHSLALDAIGNPHLAYGGDCLYYAWYDGTGWHRDIADASPANVGRYASLALDSAGYPHISYFDQTNCDVKYAYYDGATWQVEVVDPEVECDGGQTSLALDKMGFPHIAYPGGSPGRDLKYARYDGITWQIETVDRIGQLGPPSLALDAAGHSHLSYPDYTGSGLRYAFFDGATWLTETVDSTCGPGDFSSLALDAGDRPHISYFDEISDNLKYAYSDGSHWIVEIVDSAGFVGLHTSLALDASGVPHISYLGFYELRYARYDGSGWKIEQVDGDLGGEGGYTSLAVGSAGYSFVSYWDANNQKLKVARQTSTAWEIEVLDRAGQVGFDTSLALDTSSYPHISYYDATTWGLRYAFYDGTSWNTEMVDDEGSVGRFSSLVLDQTGNPHISYLDESHCDLKYAYYNGAGWVVEAVDSAGCIGFYTSLALDSADQPHISYFDLTNANLKYAYYSGGQWEIETVDYEGAAGEYTSLALDVQGHPHIAYYRTGGGLKYAYHDGFAWHIETVDNNGDVGYGASLALDRNGYPHIAYKDFYFLKYAYNDGGIWHIQSVDGAGITGWEISLALDVAGRPHIGYCGYSFSADNCAALKYALYVENSWYVETVDTGGYVGDGVSIALDANGQSHLSYADNSKMDLKYAHRFCTPIDHLGISGPTNLSSGVPGLYTAVYTPPTATLSGLDWDNGAVGARSVYSWTVTGTYILSATAISPCGERQAALSVTVFCQPVENVEISGPSALFVGQEGIYQANLIPITSSLPLTFAWDNDTLAPSAIYSWTMPGSYVITVSVANDCTGNIEGAYTVDVKLYQIHLPMVWQRFSINQR